MHSKHPPINDKVLTEDGLVSQVWAEWLVLIGITSESVTHSGVTADRPTVGLFVGRPYYDTTLQIPIWLSSVRPTVWKNSAGAAV